MKTTINFLIILSFLLSNYTAIFAQATLESKGIKGEVKAVSSTVYRTSMEDGKVKILSVAQLHKQSFNEAGYMYSKEFQVNTLSRGEGPKRKMVYDFDKDNHLIKETNYKDDTEGVSSLHTYKDGLVVETKYYKGGETFLGTQYITYDDNGNKLTSNATDPEGISIQSVELTYTKDNKVASSKSTKKGKLVRSQKHEYPNKKEEKVIVLDTKAAEETVKSYTIILYDDNKNIITSTKYTPDGKVDQKFAYEYNEQGDKTLRQISDAEGIVEDYNYMRYEYEYDEKGNWIQKTEFLKNGNSLDATKREIEYSK
jgi:hypothetical protein